MYFNVFDVLIDFVFNGLSKNITYIIQLQMDKSW